MHLWKGRDNVIVDRGSEAETLWRAKGFLPESELPKAEAVVEPKAAPVPEPAQPEPPAAVVEPIAPTAAEIAPKPIPMRRIGKKPADTAEG